MQLGMPRLDIEDAATDDVLRRIRVVLVRPQGAANLGAVARAMKNMGLTDLCLVGTSRRRVAAASTTAVHAVDLIAGARRVGSIADAIADCNLVVGTSAQEGPYRREPETPEEIADELLAVARAGRVAIVFGPESHGLSREDLQHCQRLIRIDTAQEYASINLAQAVLLVCYELRRHAAAPAGAARRPAATAADIARLDARMKSALLEMGFLNSQNPDRIMFALRRMLGRAVLRPLEARILTALAGQLQWCATAARAAKEAGIAIPKSQRRSQSGHSEP